MSKYYDSIKKPPKNHSKITHKALKSVLAHQVQNPKNDFNALFFA